MRRHVSCKNNEVTCTGINWLTYGKKVSIVARGTKQGLYPAETVRLYRCWWSGRENVCHREEADGHREHTKVYSCRIADMLPLWVIMSKSTAGQQWEHNMSLLSWQGVFWDNHCQRGYFYSPSKAVPFIINMTQYFFHTVSSCAQILLDISMLSATRKSYCSLHCCCDLAGATGCPGFHGVFTTRS